MVVPLTRSHATAPSGGSGVSAPPSLDSLRVSFAARSYLHSVISSAVTSYVPKTTKNNPVSSNVIEHANPVMRGKSTAKPAPLGRVFFRPNYIRSPFWRERPTRQAPPSLLARKTNASSGSRSGDKETRRLASRPRVVSSRRPLERVGDGAELNGPRRSLLGALSPLARARDVRDAECKLLASLSCDFEGRSRFIPSIP